MDFGIADDGERTGREQACRQDTDFSPLELCLGTSPIQAEKSLPDR